MHIVLDGNADQVIQIASNANEFLTESLGPRKRSIIKIFFVRCIQGALLSGLEAYTSNVSDYNKLDNAMIGKLRALLRGAACVKTYDPDGFIVHKPMTEVLKLLMLLPCFLELLTRRLKWLQIVVSNPEHIKQWIVTRFGRMKRENLDTLKDDGSINNEFAKIVHFDLLHLSDFPEVYPFGPGDD